MMTAGAAAREPDLHRKEEQKNTARNPDGVCAYVRFSYVSKTPAVPYVSCTRTHIRLILPCMVYIGKPP